MNPNLKKNGGGGWGGGYMMHTLRPFVTSKKSVEMVQLPGFHCDQTGPRSSKFKKNVKSFRRKSQINFYLCI